MTLWEPTGHTRFPSVMRRHTNLVWQCTVLPNIFFWGGGASCLLTLTARIYFKILCLKQKNIDINIPKQTIRKHTQIANTDVLNRPLWKFHHFYGTQIAQYLQTYDFVCKLQLKLSTINHVKYSNSLSLETSFISHWPCNIAENVLFHEIVVSIHR